MTAKDAALDERYQVKVAIKVRKVSTDTLRKLEAAGIVVTLIFSGAGYGQELKRADIKTAAVEASMDQKNAETALKLVLETENKQAASVAQK